MNLSLFINKSEPERIDKVLTSEISLTGNFRGECDVLAPTIEIATSQNLSQYNYIYIPELGRYYFITGMTIARTGFWRVVCRVDVLKTYASQIRNQTAVIDRQENKWNLYIDDANYKAMQKTRVQTKKWPNSFSQTPQYLLIIAGYNAEEAT